MVAQIFFFFIYYFCLAWFLLATMVSLVASQSATIVRANKIKLAPIKTPIGP